MSVLTESSIQKQCCICRRIKTDYGWMRPMMEIEAPVSHAYCPRCYEKALAQMEVDFATMNAQVAR